MTDLVTKLLRLPKVIKGTDFYFSSQIKVTKKTLGNEGARWTICNEPINSNSIIYSVGVGTDISFDLALISNYHVTIHAFDPTPKSIDWVKSQSVPKEFILHEYGLANYDGKANFDPPENPLHISHKIISGGASNNKSIEVEVAKLSTIMKKLNHQHIDILKMDIEGAEYDVIDDIVNSNINITQLLIEFHHRFTSITIKKTKDAIKKLNLHGYKVFDVSPNGEEYSFIKR